MGRLFNIFLARIGVVDDLSFVRVVGFQVEELFGEVRHAVKRDQVGHTLLSLAREAGFASACNPVTLRAGLGLSDAQ